MTMDEALKFCREYFTGMSIRDRAVRMLLDRVECVRPEPCEMTRATSEADEAEGMAIVKKGGQ